MVHINQTSRIFERSNGARTIRTSARANHDESESIGNQAGLLYFFSMLWSVLIRKTTSTERK